MNHPTQLQRLEKVEENINTCNERMAIFQKDLDMYSTGKDQMAPRMLTFDPAEAKRHLVITEKALRHFQHMHMRILMEYPSINMAMETLREIKELLIDKNKKGMPIYEQAWLLRLEKLYLPSSNEVLIKS